MTTLSDPRSAGLPTGGTLANFDEPPVKAPPITSAGPIAWLRNNLFRSDFDTILTFISLGVVVSVITGVIGWVVTEANWLIITFNLRQFMVGRYEPELEWRVQVVVVISVFIIGFAVAAFSRFSRPVVLVVLILLVLSFAIPAAVIPTIPLPPSYLSVGATEITVGTSTETPLDQVAFIARAGETVTVEVASALMRDDVALAGLSSFADNPANLLRAGAQARLDLEARIVSIERELAFDTQDTTLTASQRRALEDELAALSVPEPVTTAYGMDALRVEARILDAQTGEPLGAAVLAADTEPLRVTLPTDGWYILDKTVRDDSVARAGILRTSNIYPLLERNFSRAEVLDEAGTVVESGGRYSQYVRLTDGFLLEQPRPQNADGDDVPMTIIIDNQFRGEHSLATYLRLYLSPFLQLVNVPFLLIVVAAAVGYFASRTGDRLFSPAWQRRRTSQRSALWLLTALPIVMLVLVWGVGLPGPLAFSDTRRWGGLLLTILLTVVGILASFPIGVLLALGRRSELPVVSAICTIYIEFVRGVPLITVLFMAQLLVPLVNPSLAEVPNVVRAMIGIVLFSAAYLAENVRGGLQSIPPGQEEAARALGMSGAQVTLFITLPQALRAVIPALVGQFISLFKDTSLVAIVGLIDLTGISETVVAQTEFLGLRSEAYLFITLIYFGFSYVMAYVSRQIEASGSGAARRV